MEKQCAWALERAILGIAVCATNISMSGSLASSTAVMQTKQYIQSKRRL